MDERLKIVPYILALAGKTKELLEKDLSSLSDDNRIKILYLLYKNKDLNFDCIAENLNIDKNKLSLEMVILENGGFINYDEKPYPKKKYNITEKTKKIIDLYEEYLIKIVEVIKDYQEKRDMAEVKPGFWMAKEETFPILKEEVKIKG